jgi:hypothetical protein
MSGEPEAINLCMACQYREAEEAQREDRAGAQALSDVT